MMRRRKLLPWLLPPLLAACAAAAAEPEDWITVDVVVSGSQRALSAVSPEQFQVVVEGERFEHFEVEADCDPKLDAVRAASYLIYFDQPHLSDRGRAEAIGVARELMPRLLDRGGRILLASNSRELELFSPMTANEEVLRAGLARLETAPGQQAWADELLRRDRDVRYRVLERAFDRLSIVLDRFALEPGPNVAFYFADRLTSIGTSPPGETAEQFETRRFAAGAVGTAVARAALYGVRFYTLTPVGSGAWEEPPDTRAVDAAGNRSSFIVTLVKLSGGTGGRRLGRTTTSEDLADVVQRDLSCMYLLHLERGKLAADRILEMAVSLDGRATARARRWLVPQTEMAAMHSELLARLDLSGATGAPHGLREDERLEIHLIPTAYDDGWFRALVQVVASAGGAAGESWQLGGTLMAQRMVREDFAGVYDRPSPGAPLVLESEVRFGPGMWEGFAVARGSPAAKTRSYVGRDEWPDPDEGTAMVGPLVVLQETEGRFLRRGVIRSSGSLARSRRRPLRTDVRSAVMGIVCGGAGTSGKLRVARELLGQDELMFPDQEIDLSSDRCAVLTDLIPAGALDAGLYRYRVSVLHGAREVAWGLRLFSAAGAEGR